MGQHPGDETELRRYLLGEMTQEERSLVEERLFLDSGYFHQLQAVENDLVDNYVYEELSADDRERFESYFLSDPARRQDLKIARALRKYISLETGAAPLSSEFAPAARAQPHVSSKVVSLPFFRNLSTAARLSLAAAALIILSIGIWMIIKAVRNQEQSQPVQAQQPTPGGTTQTPPRREEVTTNSGPDSNPPAKQEQRAGQREKGARPEERQIAGRTKGRAAPTNKAPSQDEEVSGRAIALLLIPGAGTRAGGEIARLSLSPNVRLVNLRLALIAGKDYRSYRATLLSDGGSIRTWTGLKSSTDESGDLVSVIAPAELFSKENYQIKLSGVAEDGKARDIASYAFHVEKK